MRDQIKIEQITKNTKARNKVFKRNHLIYGKVVSRLRSRVKNQSNRHQPSKEEDKVIKIYGEKKLKSQWAKRGRTWYAKAEGAK